MKAYENLKTRFARMATIGEAQSMLAWDAAAVMPTGGGGARGEQLAVLAGVSHGLMTAAETADLLNAAEAARPTDPWESTNLSLMRHAHTRATALPGDLVEAQARACSACEKTWRVARADSDFGMVAPALGEVIALTREAAAALGPVLGMDPYDALMDGYQRGVGTADVEPIFARYRAYLEYALPLVEARQAALPRPVPLTGVFPAERQERMCRDLAARMGLDFEHARLDRSLHPFCGGTPTDVRMTTRYDERNPAQALLGVLHETGHALYEHGLPPRHARQPVGAAAGMAAHESQSLIVEMQACRSTPFLSWLGPELHRAFGGAAAMFDVHNLEGLWHRVERGFIRVDADELTYPAHVILRFSLEKAMISGDLMVADLPGAWSDGLFDLLGIRPPSDAMGCLQDIHWYDGAFGYFPSYSLGAMAAAQLMAAARLAITGLDDSLARGDLLPLVNWLRLNVHSHGSRYGFNDLLQAATGATLDPQSFEEHLNRRYLGMA